MSAKSIAHVQYGSSTCALHIYDVAMDRGSKNDSRKSRTMQIHVRVDFPVQRTV